MICILFASHLHVPGSQSSHRPCPSMSSLAARRAGGRERWMGVQVGCPHWCQGVFVMRLLPAQDTSLPCQGPPSSPNPFQPVSQPHAPATHCPPDMTVTVLPLTLSPRFPQPSPPFSVQFSISHSLRTGIKPSSSMKTSLVTQSRVVTKHSSQYWKAPQESTLFCRTDLRVKDASLSPFYR